MTTRYTTKNHFSLIFVAQRLRHALRVAGEVQFVIQSRIFVHYSYTQEHQNSIDLPLAVHRLFDIIQNKKIFKCAISIQVPKYLIH